MVEERIKLGPGMALATLKKLFSENEIAELYTGERIGTIDIEITDLCNLRCMYCYGAYSPKGNEQTQPSQRLTLEEIFLTLDQASSLDIRLFNIQGGEPMVDKTRFFKIAEYAKPKFKSLVAFTNGTFITEKDARRIAGLEMALCVKLDTLNPKTEELLTQKTGSLQKTLRGLELLRKYGVTVSINAVATPLNYYEIPDVWRFATDKGFTPFVARNHYHGRTRKNPGLQLTAEELGNLFRELQRIDREEFGIEWPADIVWPRANSCQRYRAGVFVNHKGIVLPCSETPAELFALGDIRQEPLKDTLAYDRIKRFRQIYDKLHGACSPKSCEYALKQQCYGCRVSAGDINVFRGGKMEDEFFGGDALCIHNKINPLTAKELGRKPLEPKWT